MHPSPSRQPKLPAVPAGPGPGRAAHPAAAPTPAPSRATAGRLVVMALVAAILALLCQPVAEAAPPNPDVEPAVTAGSASPPPARAAPDPEADAGGRDRGRDERRRPAEVDRGVDSATTLPAPPKPARQKPLRPKPRSDGPVVPAEVTRDAKVRQPGSEVPDRGRGAASTSAATASLQAGGTTGAPAAPAASGGTTLILYDTTGPWGFLGELYAQQTANLVSHFGLWEAHPVNQYSAGEMSGYQAVIYIGSTYDEPLPTALLSDTLAGTTPVLWMYDNIWQLSAQSGDFTAAYGWNWAGFDFSTIADVHYKSTGLERSPLNGSGIMTYADLDPTRVETPALAERSDGSTFPWVVRSENLTYIGEIPFAYVGHDDRYLVFADLLFDFLAPGTTEQHRALVRIEDVGPDADPDELRAIADEMAARNVPFSVAVYGRYEDPNGAYNGGVPEAYNLADRPAVVAALQYMEANGGTLLMHGYTHQFGNLLNPYSGASADDFEFFTAHIDSNNSVIYDGPVPGDSQAWATGRINSARAALTAAGLSQPTIFEFPHYAGSVPDYAAVEAEIGIRYDRGLYFPGVLAGGTIDYSKLHGQFFPYAVEDLYGSLVIPENIGNVEPEAFNNHPPRLPADLLATAERNLVVRDGYASFFYHPYLGTEMLEEVVDGILALGYTFVPATSIGL